MPDTDYEIVVCRVGEPDAKSRVRMACIGFYPDKIVNYLHPKDNVYAFSGHYLCSPTFVRTPSGALMPAYWPTLFVHRGVLYLLCTSTENGHLLIGASYDEGFAWTKPNLLFTAGSQPTACGFEKEPMPMLVHNGYLQCSALFGNWGHPNRFGLGTLSIAEDSDLLESSNWTIVMRIRKRLGSSIPRSCLMGRIFSALAALLSMELTTSTMPTVRPLDELKISGVWHRERK